MKWDALVVGSGPAGATAAYLLSKGGAKVLLVDSRKRVGYPVQCAEFVPLQLYHAFKEFFTPTVAQKVKEMVHFIPGRETYRSPSEGLVLNRERWEERIVSLAIKEGATLRLRTKFLGFEGRKALLKDLTTGRTYAEEADFTVGADGARSAVKKTGRATERFLSASQLTLPLREPLGDLLIYFREYAPGGYCWVFPKGKVANLGVGLEGNAAEVLPLFLREVKELVELKPLRRTGGLIPAEGLLPLVRGRVLLAGDAGGFCHPITGAGISSAVLSGSMLAEALLAGRPEDYEEEAREVFGETLSRALKKRKLAERWENLAELVPKLWPAFPDYYRD